jgi:hypothetical protein
MITKITQVLGSASIIPTRCRSSVELGSGIRTWTELG